jgi:hypothetical protein
MRGVGKYIKKPYILEKIGIAVKEEQEKYQFLLSTSMQDFYICIEFQNLLRKSGLHPAIQTVDNPTVQLPTFGSHKATIDGYSTVLAACL